MAVIMGFSLLFRLTENVAVEDDSVHHPVLTSKVQGLLRTKIEGGE